MQQPINVGIVGTNFMGKAHSNAFIKAPYFFDLPVRPVLKAACGRNKENLQAFSDKYGWETQETSWEKLLERDDIDLVDISTPNDLHKPIAVAAAKAGKHILCEKPMAVNETEARSMLDAAEEAGVVHMMIFNYRFLPAMQLAKQMIADGKIGKINHFNAVYYQDWLVDPNFPITWRHDSKTSGSGAHGDMNAHIVDLARFLLGEFEAVCGEQKTFIKQRPLADGSGSGEVSTDDATSFMARFRNGGIGSFMATRFATGRKNFLRLEIFGSEGSLAFNLERLNELQYFSRNDEEPEQGFRNILVTEAHHPYVNAWWPPGHIIGWEHTFIHEVSELIKGIANKTPVMPDFYDGLRCQQVLDAVTNSAVKEKWVEIP